jgi:uncharacterized protein YqiB (DUF1249 family)
MYEVHLYHDAMMHSCAKIEQFLEWAGAIKYFAVKSQYGEYESAEIRYDGKLVLMHTTLGIDA